MLNVNNANTGIWKKVKVELKSSNYITYIFPVSLIGTFSL